MTWNKFCDVYTLLDGHIFEDDETALNHIIVYCKNNFDVVFKYEYKSYSLCHASLEFKTEEEKVEFIIKYL